MSPDRVVDVNEAHLAAVHHRIRLRLLFALLDAPSPESTVDVREVTRGDIDDETLAFLNDEHLPKLLDIGLVERATDEYTVRRGPDFGDIEPLLRFLAAHREDILWL